MKEKTKEDIKEGATATMSFLSAHPGFRWWLIGFAMGLMTHLARCGS